MTNDLRNNNYLSSRVSCVVTVASQCELFLLCPHSGFPAMQPSAAELCSPFTRAVLSDVTMCTTSAIVSVVALTVKAGSDRSSPKLQETSVVHVTYNLCVCLSPRPIQGNESRPRIATIQHRTRIVPSPWAVPTVGLQTLPLMHLPQAMIWDICPSSVLSRGYGVHWDTSHDDTPPIPTWVCGSFRSCLEQARQDLTTSASSICISLEHHYALSGTAW